MCNHRTIMRNNEGFIGVRLGEKAKSLLTSEAEARGVSLNAHVKQILGGDIPAEDDKAAAVKEREHTNWRELVDELGDFEKKKVSLEKMIKERSSGFFAPEAPYSLRLSLQACKRAMSDLQEEIEVLLPKEDVAAARGNSDDKWDR